MNKKDIQQVYKLLEKIDNQLEIHNKEIGSITEKDTMNYTIGKMVGLKLAKNHIKSMLL